MGLDDPWARAFDLPKAFEHVDGADPVIALSHNPDTFVHLCHTDAQWTRRAIPTAARLTSPWSVLPWYL